MASIQSSGWPLVFEVATSPTALAGRVAAPTGPGTSLRTVVRAMEGMQKEAAVTIEPDGTTWRLVSDEGPYLNGTDLAPFPLAFFAAGMQFSFLSEVLQSARRHGVVLDALSLALDNRYSMDGSFLRGDAIGGAVPSELSVTVESQATPDEIAAVVREASAMCHGQAVMRDVLSNTFALAVNGDVMHLDGVAGPPQAKVIYDDSGFESVRPSGIEGDPIIEKVEAAESLQGVEGGAGSSLQAEQKRTLHVHGEARWAGGMRLECDIRLIKPIGSTFRFRCDETPSNGGDGSAPSPLVYLAAGVGFCYMTQIGRYAHIIKQPLDGYAIVQDNVYASVQADEATVKAEATETHVFINATERPEIAAELVAVGERTCFLHAAMRNELPSMLTANLNGAPLAIA